MNGVDDMPPIGPRRLARAAREAEAARDAQEVWEVQQARETQDPRGRQDPRASWGTRHPQRPQLEQPRPQPQRPTTPAPPVATPPLASTPHASTPPVRSTPGRPASPIPRATPAPTPSPTGPAGSPLARDTNPLASRSPRPLSGAGASPQQMVAAAFAKRAASPEPRAALPEPRAATSELAPLAGGNPGRYGRLPSDPLPESEPQRYDPAIESALDRGNDAEPQDTAERGLDVNAGAAWDQAGAIPGIDGPDMAGGTHVPGLPGVIVVSAPPKRRRRGWILGLSIVALFAVVLGGSYAVFAPHINAFIAKLHGPTDYTGDGTGEVKITINTGDTGDTVAQTLAEKGVVASRQIFYQLLLATRPEPVFQPGVYTLASKMSAASALHALQDPSRRVESTFRIAEGEWLSNALKDIARSTGLPLADLTALANQPQQFGLPAEAKNLEGFLFPAVYTLQPNETAKQVLNAAVQRMFQALDQAGVAPADRWRTVTIASLIQREDGTAQDAPKVARVILNRLNPSLFPTQLLQFDSTVHYGVGNSSVVTTTPAQRADASNPYNTYVHPGLTPGPIGAPSQITMNATVHPADGSWLYFVTVNPQTGETVFSSTLANHNAAVAKFQQWLQANPSWGS